MSVWGRKELVIIRFLFLTRAGGHTYKRIAWNGAA